MQAKRKVFIRQFRSNTEVTKRIENTRNPFFFVQTNIERCCFFSIHSNIIASLSCAANAIFKFVGAFVHVEKSVRLFAFGGSVVGLLWVFFGFLYDFDDDIQI